MQVRSDPVGNILFSVGDRLRGLDRIVIERDLRGPIPVVGAKSYLESPLRRS
jgi:hypothetical protein